MDKKKHKRDRARKRAALAMVVGGDDSHVRDYYNPSDGNGFPMPRVVSGGVDSTTGQPWYITVWS